MEVVLLGTGGADGWPNPFCTCASCDAARATGELRGQTSALVDDVLLLDCGPEAPRAALRHGRTLAGVRAVLVTHAHPDHLGPAFLLWRRWASCSEPLEVVGPPAVLEACRDWIGPDDPVELRSVAAGDRLRVAEGYDVRVLPAAHAEPQVGPAVLYDVTGPDRARVLWGTDTGVLADEAMEAVAGAAYDLVLLEESMGDAVGVEPGHLDLESFPRQVARLRQVGAIGSATDVVAVHLTHRNPPTPELARRLRAWEVRVVPDGTVLDVPPSAAAAAAAAAAAGSGAPRTGRGGRDAPERPGAGGPRPRRVLVLGGARSGKSVEAERRLAAEPEVTYVATGPSGDGDAEWAARVAAHQARRPQGWTTRETRDLPQVLASTPGPVLVDCLSLWLAAQLDAAGVWDGADLTPVRVRVDELVAAWRARTGPLVAVSNEVGSGVVPATASGRLYRDELGRLNARIAAESDEVVLMVAGVAVPVRSP